MSTNMVETDSYEIYLGDCLHMLKGLQDKSIDMVLCDLPYNVTKNDWDNEIIDLGLLWKEYKRIIKDRGAIVLFGQDKFTAKLLLSEPKLHRYNLIWDKVIPSGFLNANRMPLRSHEDICVFNYEDICGTKGVMCEYAHEDICVFYKKLPEYTPQMKLGDKPCHSMGKGVLNHNNNYGDFELVDNSKERGCWKHPKSILRFEKPHPSICCHPTQKPVPLLVELIKMYTKEGQVVLDNTMGSGSTGVASIETGRYFIGIEKQKEYFDISVQRLKLAKEEKELKIL